MAWDTALDILKEEEGAKLAALIRPEDIKVEIWPPHEKGGQHVYPSRGVMVTHLPTGTMAMVTTSAGQHRNREIAMHMIEAAITHPKFRL